MLRIVLLMSVIGMCCRSFAQDSPFADRNMPLQKIMEQAKKEGKYVMLDFYTTSSKSCQQMARNVYPDSKITAMLKEQFIAVKVQMDATSKDDSLTKKWHEQARELGSEYGIKAYPTYLFFDPDGSLVHKGAGARSVNDFVMLLKDALNPDRQYVTLINKGAKYICRDSARLLYVMKTAMLLNDAAVEKKIARTYITGWEKKGRLSALQSLEVVRSVAKFITSSDKNWFRLLYPSSKGMDSIARRDGFGENILNAIIMNEEVNAYIVENGDYELPKVEKPDWDDIYSRIRKKYGYERADRLVLSARRKWYKTARVDWNMLAQAHVTYFNSYAPMNSGVERAGINNTLYEDVFLTVHDTALLRQAAAVLYRVIQLDSVKASSSKEPNAWMPVGGFMDTYANLLYKGGQADTAIYWQEKAVAILKGNKEVADNLQKMKNGQFTWPAK